MAAGLGVSRKAALLDGYAGEGGMAGPELAAMLLFSAVFGYMLRTIEARRDLEASLLLPS